MLAKKYRLVGQNNFKKLAIDGKSFFLKEMGLKWLPNNLSNSRFAFVVSLQIDKRAVRRNQIKRWLRQIIHSKLAEIKAGFDFLFLTRPAIKNLDFPKLKELVENLLKKSELL